MKIRATSLVLVCLTLAAVPAMAGTVYSNGPTNGNTDAWTINFGYVVSDTFNVPSGGATITGANFAMWLYPGDTLESANLDITEYEFGGTNYFNGTVNFTQSGCVVNDYGYDVCQEATSLTPTALNSGTYWLTLQNAVVSTGDPVYWDENSGPSEASNNAVGTLPSESFTVLGSTSSSTTGTVPEPGSLALFASAFVGISALMRRKLF